MHDNRPIGIFDSGIGGLTVFSEIKKLLPQEYFIYFADQASFPYGRKSKAQLRSLAHQAVNFLLSKNVKAIVIACNTGTVYAIDFLRSKFGLPIIGVVPVVKTIVERTKTGKTLIFATPATAKSHYLEDLVRRFSNGKKVYIGGGSNLEKLIEKGRVEDPAIDKILDKNLMPFIREGVDSIALGCTHYPFVRQIIEAKVGSLAQVYDSGAAVARRVKQVLTKENLLSSKRAEDVFYTSGNPLKFRSVSEELLGERLGHVEKAVI